MYRTYVFEISYDFRTSLDVLTKPETILGCLRMRVRQCVECNWYWWIGEYRSKAGIIAYTRAFTLTCTAWISLEINGVCNSAFTELTQTQCGRVCWGQGTKYRLTSSRVTTRQNRVTCVTFLNVTANGLQGPNRAIFSVVFYWKVIKATLYIQVLTMIFRVKRCNVESDKFYHNFHHI